MNDARLKQIELQNERALFDDRYALVKELSKALRESQAREAKLREIIEHMLTRIYNAGLRPPDGGTPTVDDICTDLNVLMQDTREALKETKP